MAYADFVTALMALFLLLWLLSVTNQKQKEAISTYFQVPNVAPEQSGSGGVLGGMSIQAPGAQIQPETATGLHLPMPGAPDSGRSVDSDNGNGGDGPDSAADSKREYRRS